MVGHPKPPDTDPDIRLDHQSDNFLASGLDPDPDEGEITEDPTGETKQPTPRQQEAIKDLATKDIEQPDKAEKVYVIAKEVSDLLSTIKSKQYFPELKADLDTLLEGLGGVLNDRLITYKPKSILGKKPKTYEEARYKVNRHFHALLDELERQLHEPDGEYFDYLKTSMGTQELESLTESIKIKILLATNYLTLSTLPE